MLLPISSEDKPFIIAEMSGNHNGDLGRALAIVEAAAKAGASALKLQTYTPDTMTIDSGGSDFRIDDEESLWAGRTLYDLYGEAHTPWEWHEEIFALAKKRGMLAFSSPFDATAVDFLDSLGVPAFKIASFENTDLPLIRKAAAKGKPLIISTGLANIQEIDEAVRTARKFGAPQVVLLKTTSSYPATAENANISTIPMLRDLFDCEVGLSDHTLGIGVSVASIALGATVIEKHFTLDRADGGVDSAFSMDPSDLARLVQEGARARAAIGKPSFGPTESELGSLAFRRSIYAVEDINVGDIFDERNVRVIRPGFGLEPKHLDKVLGRQAKRDIPKGSRITWDLLG